MPSLILDLIPRNPSLAISSFNRPNLMSFPGHFLFWFSTSNSYPRVFFIYKTTFGPNLKTERKIAVYVGYLLSGRDTGLGSLESRVKRAKRGALG